MNIKTKIIQSDQIILRPITEKDVPLMTRWLNDEEICQYIQADCPISEEGEKKWFYEIKNSKTDFVFGILDKESKNHIGNIGLHHVNKDNLSATVGIFIGDKSKWGKGYGTEALKLIINLAFGEMGLEKLQAPIFDFNENSIKVFENLDFTLDKTENYKKSDKNLKVLQYVLHSPIKNIN